MKGFSKKKSCKQCRQVKFHEKLARTKTNAKNSTEHAEQDLKDIQEYTIFVFFDFSSFIFNFRFFKMNSPKNIKDYYCPNSSKYIVK